MERYVIGVDQGTTGTKAIIFDLNGNTISSSHRELKKIYPQPGWVEQDPNEILNTVIETISEAFFRSGLRKEELLCLGLANQGETVIIWDKQSGDTLYNAISWQCLRTEGYCNTLRSLGIQEEIHKKTGLFINPYFAASKIRWLLDNIPNVRKKAKAGRVIVGTVDSWIIWNLTRRKVFATDPSTASRTLLFNINSFEWDPYLLEIFDIPQEMLAELRPSGGNFGYINHLKIPINLPITASICDQQASLFGHSCYEFGQAKNTYGTGCFLLMNIGDNPKLSKNNLLTTIAWKIDSIIRYAMDGGIKTAGAAIKWLIDDLGLIIDPKETETLATKIPNSGGVYFLPSLTGMAAPYWKSKSKAIFAGLTITTTKENIVRAVLESIAYRVRDIIEALKKDVESDISELCVDGAMTNNSFLMQFQADILGIPIIVPKNQELTSLGASLIAKLGTGLFGNGFKSQNKIKVKKIFYPSISVDQRETFYSGWKRFVRTTIDFEI